MNLKELHRVGSGPFPAKRQIADHPSPQNLTSLVLKHVKVPTDTFSQSSWLISPDMFGPLHLHRQQPFLRSTRAVHCPLAPHDFP